MQQQLKDFDLVCSRIRERMTDGQEREQFCGACTAVSYRYKASEEYSADFLKHLQKAAADLYQQEKALFGFFTSALASIESFYFGLYFFGWLLSPEVFECVSKAESITVKKTVEAFRLGWVDDPFVSVLTKVRDDVHFKELEDIRNILVHRVVPGRIKHLQVAIGGEPPPERPDNWKILSLFNIDPRLTESRLAWLADTLALLMREVAEFSQRHL